MRRALLALVAVAVLAGCGGSTRTPPVARPPHIPRALAQSWATRASAVAQEIARGNTCTARDDASELAASVAESAYRVPVRLRTRLTAVVAALPARIPCNPAPPTRPTPPAQPVHPPHEAKARPPKPPHHPDHGGHGHGHGGDQGDNG